jgi:DNA-directed RNA polymerase specialized sigma24 family protein
MGVVMDSSDASASTSGLAQLFEEHRPQLLRFLRARGAGDAADDLIQELWIRIALKLVQAEIDALGERAATVFRRYRLEGESQRDIAQDLGVSLSSVEKDLQRAYRVLLDMKRRKDAGI